MEQGENAAVTQKTAEKADGGNGPFAARLDAPGSPRGAVQGLLVPRPYRAGNKSKLTDESKLGSLSKGRVGEWGCIKLGW